jgi:catechol 2,3-dioxygenase
MTQITPIPEKADQYRPRGLRIGHVHLKVADLERSLGFWRDVIGLHVMQRIPQAVFLSADGYHHHIAINTWDSEGGAPPAPGSTGLFHVALLYPSRRALAGQGVLAGSNVLVEFLPPPPLRLLCKTKR